MNFPGIIFSLYRIERGAYPALSRVRLGLRFGIQVLPPK
jgi:hypothetical protein